LLATIRSPERAVSCGPSPTPRNSFRVRTRVIPWRPEPSGARHRPVYARRPGRTSSILRTCAPGALGTELARAQAESLAEQPAERTQALEADGECNRRDGLVGFNKQSPSCPQPALLQEPHGSLVKRQPERVVEVVRGKAGSLGGQGHGNRLAVARAKEVAPAM